MGVTGVTFSGCYQQDTNYYYCRTAQGDFAQNCDVRVNDANEVVKATCFVSDEKFRHYDLMAFCPANDVGERIDRKCIGAPLAMKFANDQPDPLLFSRCSSYSGPEGDFQYECVDQAERRVLFNTDGDNTISKALVWDPPSNGHPFASIIKRTYCAPQPVWKKPLTYFCDVKNARMQLAPDPHAAALTQGLLTYIGL